MYILTISDVVGVDGDVGVSVRSALLVPAPQGVQDLVHDQTVGVAVGSYGDVLLPSSTTNTGIAPGRRKTTDTIPCGCSGSIVLTGEGHQRLLHNSSM